MLDVPTLASRSTLHLRPLTPQHLSAQRCIAQFAQRCCCQCVLLSRRHMISTPRKDQKKTRKDRARSTAHFVSLFLPLCLLRKCAASRHAGSGGKGSSGKGTVVLDGGLCCDPTFASAGWGKGSGKSKKQKSWQRGWQRDSWANKRQKNW